MTIVTWDGIFVLFDMPKQQTSVLNAQVTTALVSAAASPFDRPEQIIFAAAMDRIIRPPVRRARR